MTTQQTWDQAFLCWLRSRVARRRAGVAVVALAMLCAVLSLPSVAHAHDWEAPGINDAHLNLSPDGYDGNGGVNTVLGVGAWHRGRWNRPRITSIPTEWGGNI